jgi:hypothetical protein
MSVSEGMGLVDIKRKEGKRNYFTLLYFMKKTITLTEDMLKLIPFFYIQEFDDSKVGVDKQILFNLGSHLMEDMAMILGKMDHAIPNTAEDGDGRAFDDETTDYMLEIFNYLSENIVYIESLVHQYACMGGLKAATYKCLTNEMIWSEED